ncbi:MAG: carboxypeptidase-like regulatory domain-containing protein, partial [Planctomycetaceae bacterium]
MPRISVVDADSPYDEAAEVNSLGVPYEPDVKQVTRPVQDFALLKLPERVAGEVVDNVTGKRVEGATVTFRFYLGSDTDRANADATFTFRDVGQFEFDIPEKFRPNANNEGSAPPLIRCTVERIVEHPDYQPLERSTMSFGRLAQITMADYVSRWFQRIELTPGVEVTGQVLDFDRRPAKGIRVFSGRNRAGWQNGCVHETFTDADGRYRLIVPKKHGPGRIYVIPDHASAVSRAITPEFGEQEVFQLRRGTRLHGKVVDVDGKGVPRIVVRTNGGERIPWRYAVTDSKGEYTMPPLQYGTYDIELIDQGQIPDSMHIGSRLPFVYVNRKLTLSKDAPVERRLDFPPVEKVTVTARCTNSDGSPVTGSTFSIYGTANTTHWRGTLTDVPGEPGTYSVRVPKGIQQLRVEHVGGRYFYRITRHSQNGAEPLGNWFVQVDEDDDSLRIERWNAATIRVRTLVDGKRFDVVSGHGGLHWPRFADVEHARKLGGEAATSIMLNSPDDRGFWQTDVHPEIDIVLKIDAPGFAPWSKTVRLDEGEIREIDVPLERIVDRSVERRVTP